MATKKTTKSATKKSSAKPATKKASTVKKPVAKKSTTKRVSKPVVEEKSILNTDVSILLAMAVESLILLLGYLIIMSVA